MGRDDVYRTPWNRVGGIDSDQFRAGQSATDRNWRNDEDQDLVFRWREGIAIATALAGETWSEKEAWMWHQHYREQMAARCMAPVVGYTIRHTNRILARLRQEVVGYYRQVAKLMKLPDRQNRP